MKFSHIIVCLPEELSTLVHDDIVVPPEMNKYKHLKSRLIKEFSLTSTNRAAELLDFPGIGDLSFSPRCCCSCREMIGTG